MAKPKFPSTMIVKREVERDGDVYYVASVTAREHAEVGEEVEVAVYKLLRVTKVRADPVMK